MASAVGSSLVLGLFVLEHGSRRATSPLHFLEKQIITSYYISFYLPVTHIDLVPGPPVLFDGLSIIVHKAYEFFVWGLLRASYRLCLPWSSVCLGVLPV